MATAGEPRDSEGASPASPRTAPEPQLVVTGSSAGGIDALSTLVASLPPDFAAPVVIAQHLDPARKTRLHEILQRRTALAVRLVTSHEALQPGCIYVVPAGHHVEITDHAVAVQAHGPGDGRVQPSVDRLFRSAAAVFGERLIAVILSGTGVDGSDGARQVKAVGGTVVVQNPETAEYAGMPASLAPTTIDLVANVEMIGPLLHDLVSGTYTAQRPEDQRLLQGLLSELHDRSGIDFNTYKRPTILRRLQRRMAATGSPTLRDYLSYLQEHVDEYQRLVNAFLIKVTEFFRDADLYEYLRSQVFPDMVAQARQRGNELRIWSAGCATGEEAYSLAILVSELLGDELEQFNIRIFATDLDNEAVAFARRGVYPGSAAASLGPEALDRYFTRTEDGYEVKKALRALVVFGQHDLGQRAPFPRIDLALCRNVLIYFTPELQKRALQLFAFSLREGGYLVLGKAETTTPLAELFTLEQPRLKVYRRSGPRVLFPTTPARQEPPALAEARPFRPLPTRLSARGPGPLVLGRRSAARGAGRNAAEAVLSHLSTGVVVIDRRYDILSINNAARRLLNIHGPALGNDFIHAAQGLPSTELRNLVEQAFRGEPLVAALDGTIADVVAADARSVRLVAERERSDASDDGVVVLLVHDVTDLVRERRETEARAAREREEAERLRALLREATESARQLTEGNQALSAANEELRSANHDLLVANEEVQAATEEAETLNEEMQASNEEMETLNEELQATVEELNTTNDDLLARSMELQELASSLEEQRAQSIAEQTRLEAVLASMSDAMVVVDPAGEVVLANAAMETVLPNARGAAFRAENADGQPLPEDEAPRARAASGETFRMEFGLTLPGGERRWFEAHGRPIGGRAGKGGVLVIRDITDRSLYRLQQEFLALASHELRAPLTTLGGALTLLAREVREAGERPRRRVELARTQVERLSTLVAELLDVTLLQQGRLRVDRRPVDTGSVVRRVAELAEPILGGQALRTDLAEGPLVAAVDEARLEQVLLNLLGNAGTHASGSTHVHLTLKRVESEAEISVRDHGAGLPPEEVARLFERFYRPRGVGGNPSSGAGLGLGLYLAHEIVQAHGGTIQAASEAGRGTTFTIRLPLATEPEAPAA